MVYQKQLRLASEKQDTMIKIIQQKPKIQRDSSEAEKPFNPNYVYVSDLEKHTKVTYFLN